MKLLGRPLVLVLTIALAACATEPMPSPKVTGDDVDRIVAAVGVDAMHSVDEEPRMQALAGEALSSAPSLTALRASPDFERVVRHLMLDNQRMRRDPSVFQAYRTTLERMLTPAERKAAAEFYGSPEGLKAHIAVIEADKAAAAALEATDTQRADDPAVLQAFNATLERMLTPTERAVGAKFYGSPEGQKIHAAALEGERAASLAMDDVAARMGKEPPPNSTHYFQYGIDVFFARDSAEVDPVQRERIVSILKKPRDAEPTKEWCALLVGFSGTGERAPTLAERRREAVKRVLIEFGIPEVNVSTHMQDAKGANLKPGDRGAWITEIEQFPCAHATRFGKYENIRVLVAARPCRGGKSR